MSGTEHQKRKILYLKELLERETDEDHPLTGREIQKRLTNAGYPAERRSVASDLAELQDSGLSLAAERRGKGYSYWISERTFELSEIRILLDELEASRFLSPAKAYELAGKLKTLLSVHQAKKLQIDLDARVRHRGEETYDCIRCIHSALERRRALSFLYFEYDLDKKVVYRKSGSRYFVSPRDVLWSEGNYYLAADYGERGLTTFRVDRMAEAREEEISASSSPQDTAAFFRETFSMYSGRSEVVELICENSLVTAVLDRFGRDTGIRRNDAEHFAVLVRVQISPTFFGWCCNFGERLQIASPAAVREEYRQLLSGILAGYK